jgi:uncharacterized protein (DUF169 family)
MEWKKHADELQSLLGLEGSPVAVTFSMEPADDALKGKHRVCDAFIKARDGATIDLTSSSSACHGGTWFLGLAEPPTGEEDRALKDFLVNGEKLFSSVVTFCRSRMLSTPPPTGMADHVILEPLDRAKRRPDLILFICNPEQASRLVTLDMYDTGVPPRIEMSGATCHQAVGYPAATGELNVSLMDYTSRRSKAYKKNDLIVSIPCHRFHGVMRSIEGCTAGRAKFEVPDRMRRTMDPAALRDLEG